jgi:hypothetical protein
VKPEPPRLKPLHSPSRIRVRTDEAGLPLKVQRRNGRVAAIREIWRIDDEWWRQPISRLYHEIILESGRLLTVYLDLIEGEWWEQ